MDKKKKLLLILIPIISIVIILTCCLVLFVRCENQQTLTSDMVTLESYEYVYDGNEKRPSVTITTLDNKVVSPDDYTVTYENNIGVGSASVTIVANENSKLISGSVTVNFNIVGANIMGAIGELKFDPAEYNGENQIPNLNITGLVENQDYTILWEYRANESEEYVVTDGSNFVNAGTYRVTISGIGNYSGTVNSEYIINSKSVSEANITLEYDEIEYSGNENEPNVTVTVEGNTLRETEYNVSYENNINVGMASVKITLNGNYSAIITRQFEILPKDISSANILLEYEIIEYSGDELKPSVSLSIDDVVLNSEFLQISYSNNISVGMATVLVSGTGNYSGQLQASFEITVKKITQPTISTENAEITYDGTQHTVLPLPESEFYTVSGNTQTNVGDYEAIVTLVDKKNTVWESTNSTDDLRLSYKIVARAISKEDISLEFEITEYTGSQIKPEISIEIDGNTLNYGNDFTANYSDNVFVGDASVTIVGTGNYTGNITLYFEITPKVITTPTVQGAYTYTGSSQTAILSSDNNYFTISNATQINAGTYKILVSLKDKSNTIWSNDSTNDIELDFVINSKNISSGIVQLNRNDFIYTGSEINPIYTIKVDDVILVADTDYSALITDNVNVGFAKITITGKNNYTGELIASFEITPQTVVQPTLVGSYTYTGESQTAKLSYESELFIVSNNIQINAGNYEVLVSLVDKQNMIWETTENSNDLSLKFEIQKASYVNITASRTSYAYNETPTSLTLSSEVEGTKNYYYSNSMDMDNPTLFDENTKLNSGNYYFFALISESQNYNEYKTAISSFEVYKVDLTGAEIIFDSENYTYTGLEIIPEIQVKLNGVVLDGQEYDVKFLDNINAGTATAIVSGINNYYGSTSSKFMIIVGSDPCLKHTESDPVIENLTKATTTTDGSYEEVVYCKICGTEISRVKHDILKINTENISVDLKDEIYDGTEKIKEITVNGYILDTDYTISYQNNTNAGVATIIIKFIGYYDATLSYSFNILQQEVEMPTIVGTYEYNWEEQTVKLSYYSDLFDISNTTQTNAGTYKVVVSLKDKTNYKWKDSSSDDLSLDFVISQKDLSSASVKLEYETIIYSGAELKPTVQVELGDKILVQNQDFFVTYSNNIKVGKATVSIRGDVNFTGECSSSFEIKPFEVEEPEVQESYAYNEAEQTILKDTEYYIVKNAVLVNAGTYDVVVSLRDKENYIWKTNQNSQDISFKVVIVAGIVSEPEITGTFTFNGKPQTALTDTKYYTVSNNVQTNAGKYTVIVSLVDKANYVWKNSNNNENLELEFIIESADINEVQVNLESNSYTFTGDIITPNFSLKFEDIDLVSGEDFTYSVLNNIDVGQGRIEITGQKNFKGTKVVYFDITPQSVTVPTVQNLTFDGTTQTALEGNSIFTVKGASNLNAGKYEMTLSLINTQNYVWETTGESADITVEYEILPLDINNLEFEISPESQIYTGSEIVDITLSATIGNYIVNKDTDYILSFENNVNVGTAIVYVQGKDNFNGTAKLTFEISTRYIKVPSIVGSYTYTGESQSVKLSEESTFFTVLNNSFTNAGEYELVLSLTDKDNCVWEDTSSNEDVVLKFTIKKQILTKPQISGEYLYNGQQQSVEISNLNDEILVTGNVQTDAGSHIVKFTLKDDKNFIWDDETSEPYTMLFVIASRNIEELSFVIEDEKFNFTNEEIKPEFELKYNDYVLIENVDYKVTYTGNVNVGIGQILINGINNFTGSIVQNFEIVSGEIIESNVNLSAKKSIYTGENVMPTIEVVYLGNVLISNQDYDYTWFNSEKQVVYEIINAGTYTLKINGLNNYESSVEIEFVVEKANYDNLTVSRKNYTYGEEKTSIEFSGLVEGSVNFYYFKSNNPDELIEFTQTDELNAGEYYFVAIIGESQNYNSYTTAQSSFIINKANYSNISVYREDYDYGNPSIIEVNGYTESDYVLYFYLNGEDISNSKEFDETYDFEIGTYYFYVVIPESLNYNEYVSEATTFTVNRADYNQEITISRDSYKYGETHTPTILSGFTGSEELVSYYYSLSNINIGGTKYTDYDEFNAGTYYIYAVISENGNYNEYVTATYEFVVEKGDYGSVIVQRENYTYGETKTEINLSATVYGTVTYYYNQENTTVNGTQFDSTTDLVAGTYYIYAVIAESDNYNGYTTATSEFVVNHILIDRPKVENLTFTGFAQTLIKENSNYSITNNLQTNAGTYKVTVSLNDNINYAWSDTITSEELNLDVIIEKANMTNVIVQLSQIEYTYSGEENKPTVTVTLEEYLLTELDYSISYSSNVNAGTASVNVKAADNSNFTGEKIVQFTINQANYSDVIVLIGNYNYTNQSNVQLSSVVEGTVKFYYYKASDSKDNAVLFDASTILDAGEYYCYAVIDESINYHSYETEITSFEVLKMSISNANIEIENSSFAYTSDPIYPNILKISINGFTLQAGTDYEYTLQDKNLETVDYLLEVGDYSLIISGKGNYEGSKSIKLSVLGLSLSEAEVTIIGGTEDANGNICFDYTSEGITPDIVVKIGDTTLELGKDYSVSYTENINVGTAIVTITGIGGYLGERIVNFEIVLKTASLENAEISRSEFTSTYTGSNIYSTISFTVSLNGVELIKDVDYQVIWTAESGTIINQTTPSFINADTYTGQIVAVEGGNYTGEVTQKITVTISPRTLLSSYVTLSSTSADWTGEDLTPTITVKYNGRTINARYYTVEITNDNGDVVSEITNTGTYTIKVTGNDNFTGTVTKTFIVN